MIATITIHVGIVALLLTSTVKQPQTPDTRTLSVFNISAAAAPATPKAAQPKPATPAPPPVLPLPIPSEDVVATSREAGAPALSGACDLTEPVRAALQSNETVVASLYQLPRDKLSVANAIMIWQADWLADDGQVNTAAVATIRDVIAETIAAATDDCRLQPQVGPRLLLLSGASDTVVLAVGSGEWRWQDLLETARPSSASDDVREGAAPQAILASLDRASIAGR